MSRQLSEVERRRRRLRLILVLGSLPVLVALLVVAVKLISLPIVAGTAIGQFERGDYDASRDTSTSLLDANVIEPWIPYFNRGDAKVAAENYTSAIDDFEKALELAPVDRQCMVRVNLARTWETLGDIYAEAGYPQGAIQLYQAAQGVLEGAGEECVPDTPESDDLQQTEDDVEAKLDQAEQVLPFAPDDGEGTQQEQLDQLDERSESSEQERSDEEARENGDESGGSFTDKPW